MKNDNISDYIKQQGVWARGPMLALSYATQKTRIIPSLKLFIHYLYWLLEPLLMIMLIILSAITSPIYFMLSLVLFVFYFYVVLILPNLEQIKKTKITKNMFKVYLGFIAFFCIHSFGPIKRIIPYYNNEPFLDKNFIELLKWFKKNTPDIEIEVSTNLSICKDEDIQEIVSKNLIQDFRISFFGGKPETYKKMMPKLDFAKNISQLSNFLEIRKKFNPNFNYVLIMVLYPELSIEEEKQALRNIFPDEKLNFRFFGYLDRAGSNEKTNIKLSDMTKDFILRGCSLNRNTERMCLDVNGNIPLCSQDWFLSSNLGNLSRNSILEIWNGKNKNKIDNMINGDNCSSKDFICNKCKLALIETPKGKRLNFEGDKYMTENDKKRFQL